MSNYFIIKYICLFVFLILIIEVKVFVYVVDILLQKDFQLVESYVYLYLVYIMLGLSEFIGNY